MNTFNRLVMIIFLLGTALAIAAGILLILLAPQAIAPIFTNMGKILSAGPNDRNLNSLRLELTVLGLVLFVPTIFLLWLEVRRSTRDAVRIASVGGSEARLSMQAVAQSLVYYIDALPSVVRVRPRLSADSKSVSVRLDVETTPDIDVRAMTEEITKTARSVVEERLGLKLKSLQIQLHHTTFPRVAAIRPPTAEALKPLAKPPAEAPPSVSTPSKNPLS